MHTILWVQNIHFFPKVRVTWSFFIRIFYILEQNVNTSRQRNNTNWKVWMQVYRIYLKRKILYNMGKTKNILIDKNRKPKQNTKVNKHFYWFLKFKTLIQLRADIFVLWLLSCGKTDVRLFLWLIINAQKTTDLLWAYNLTAFFFVHMLFLT